MRCSLPKLSPACHRPITASHLRWLNLQRHTTLTTQNRRNHQHTIPKSASTSQESFDTTLLEDSEYHAEEQQVLEPGLYVVATPIGNLQDITLRALNVLKLANIVLAEDTRHTRKLLNHFGIKAEMVSYHAHNEKGREHSLINRLKSGEVMALVSDAGTPAISDPGQGLVAAAIEQGIPVIPIPGPCALITALVASGLPTTQFTFCGFLPPKSVARKKVLEGLKRDSGTLVFYVPPHGLLGVLSDALEVLGGERRCCVARELTKKHEEYFRSTISGALTEFQQREPRGEIVFVVQGFAGEPEQDTSEVSVKEKLSMLLELGLPVNTAAKEVAKQLGISKSDVYAVALEVKKEREAAST